MQKLNLCCCGAIIKIVVHFMHFAGFKKAATSNYFEAVLWCACPGLHDVIVANFYLHITTLFNSYHCTACV